MDEVKNKKRIINGWIFYDWANSVYPLVVTSTIFPTFFEKQTTPIVSFFGMEIINTQLYAYMGALSFIIVSICCNKASLAS